MKSSRGIKDQMKNLDPNSPQDMELLQTSVDEWAHKMFKQGLTPKDAMGVSNQFLEGVYSQAYRLYNTGKYVEASHLFRILILIDPVDPKYVLGLAACFHMLKEYKNAIQTYTMCLLLDPQNPIPHYHCSDCFIQMKDFPSAMVSLELTIKNAGERPEFSKMKERAMLSLESLKKQMQSGSA